LKRWHYIPEHINPNIVEIGTFQLRYYAVMYVVAFILIYFLVLFRIKNEKLDFNKENIQNYFVWGILGVMVGGRLGYVLFYDFDFFVSNPLKIIFPFEISRGEFHYIGISGMSYHGGLMGVFLASIFFCQKYRINFWKLADLLSPAIPLGYTFGRIGNFINGELYGRTTSVSWGMYFPLDATHQLRHPSQLYEAFFEGIFLFLILWSLKERKLFDGFVFCLYLIGYGVIRFFIEFLREPDSQLGFIFGPFTMGQILCFCMIFTGIFIMIIKKQHIRHCT
jgi:phosphatidylglycerol:prolipoprotein diacylglycerol transferase